MQRSAPGQGELVQMFLVDEAAVDSGCEPLDVLCIGVVEDFAICRWPVVVKAKVGLSRPEIVRHLLFLASQLDGA